MGVFTYLVTGLSLRQDRYHLVRLEWKGMTPVTMFHTVDDPNVATMVEFESMPTI